MAKHGFMIEKRLSAKDVEALNRTAKATVAIDGGTLVKLGDYADGVWDASVATEGNGLYIAYNPSEHFTDVDGKLFAGLSKDPRDYTNIADRPFDVAKLVVDDIIGLTDGNIKADDIATVAVGKYLEASTDGLTVKDSATADTTSLHVIGVETLPFPNGGNGGVGMEFAKLYICEVAQN